ncbi:MAG: acetylxylan esterase [Paludibacteraceae bacterium]|nr:acetylxylan esterase [Paludibacteraceae bacterium]
MRDNIYIGFEPSHTDWVYALGEDVKVEVSLREHYCPVPNVVLHCEWGPEMRAAETTFDVQLGKSGVEVLTLKGAKTPGFKTLQISAEWKGKTYSNIIKIAFAPDRMQPTATLPKDFSEFWADAIDKARQVPLLPFFVRKPEFDTPFCDTYEVRFQNTRKGNYLYGMMALPKGVCPTDTVATRKYPVLILWPGAGVMPHLGECDFFPEHGVITLEMGIHGIPVTLPKQLYADLNSNALRTYSVINSPNPSDYYYNKVYVGTVRTVDFLCSLPFVDADRIGCFGGSQGGALSAVNAALDSRIRCAAISFPALTEIAGYARGRAEGWPHLFRLEKVDERNKTLIEVADYYDVVNFSRQIRCKVIFYLGFNDITCCPSSTYTCYNVIPGEKELVTMQPSGHWMHMDYRQQRSEWLLEQLLK